MAGFIFYRSKASGESGRFIPAEIRPDVGATPTARRADETRLKIRQPDVIRPGIGAGSDVVAALVI
jgi:hypothetical protein